MNKNYAIMRFEKIHSVRGLTGKEQHFFNRADLDKKEFPRAHPELEYLNRYFVNPEYKDCENVKDAFKKATEGVKIRKNAVYGFEFIFSASDFSDIDIGEWVMAQRKWIQKTFGESSLYSMHLQYDESSPHMHAIVFPFDERDGKRILNARKYINGKAQLSIMQDDYAREMAPFGLVRGDGEKRDHLDTETYWRIQERLELEASESLANDILSKG